MIIVSFFSTLPNLHLQFKKKISRKVSTKHLIINSNDTDFRRFAPNVSEVSEEFNQLAIAFNDSYLPQYAAMCWLGASKCEETFGKKNLSIIIKLN